MDSVLNYRNRQLGTGDVKVTGHVTHLSPIFPPEDGEDFTYQSHDSQSQVTGSISHQRGSDGKFHSGGPFYTERSGTKEKVTIWNSDVKFYSSGQWFTTKRGVNRPIAIPEKYIEEFISPVHNPVPHRSKDLSDLDSYGATAISQCSPANPASELGTGVSELYREGLPSLPGVHTWQGRTALAKSAGSEYLNVQFGWDPLVDEVKSLASVVRRHRDILNQYNHNAGSLVHRQYSFPVVKEEESFVLGTGTARGISNASGENVTPKIPPPGEILLTRGVQTKRWFSGAFTFDVPNQDDSWQRALGYGSDADILFGASLNPELLWNLTPWSWAVDWFSNTGDVINNISNYVRAGQVMSYGYIMEENYSYTRLSMTSSGSPGIPAPGSIERYSLSKVREQANPFGFGLTSGDLSPTQLAIAAALGLTLL